jgi:hypothetical protein
VKLLEKELFSLPAALEYGKLQVTATVGDFAVNSAKKIQTKE